MKKTNKENPLTFFRKANESRQKVVKNSLAKAQNGIVAGPQTEMQSILSNAMNSQPPVPYANKPSSVDFWLNETNKAMSQMSNNLSSVNQKRLPDFKGPAAMSKRTADGYKKGGAVKTKKK
jgi:hypothetical protein